MKRSRIALAFLAALMLVAAMLPLGVSGAERTAEPVYMLADFSASTDGFYAWDNVSSVAAVDFAADPGIEPDDYTPTRACLLAESMLLDVNLIRCAAADFGIPHDLTEYRTFRYDMYVLPYEPDPDAEYFTRLTLTADDGDTMESIDGVTPGQWNTISADISEWAGRREIVSAEVALIIGTTVREFNKNSFYLDDLRAEDPVDRTMTARYLMDTFEVTGGSALIAGDKSMITFTAQGGTPFSFGGQIFAPELKLTTNCLRLRISNRTAGESMTVHYSTYDTLAMSEAKSVTVALQPNSEAQYYYVSVGDVTKLRHVEFRFGNAPGRVELYSISAVSAYVPARLETCGEITACTLGDDLSSVTFSGTVSREEALANQAGSIRIYRIKGTDIPTAETLSGLTPAATSPMTTRFDLTYRLPGKDKDELHAMYLAVSVRTDGTHAIIAPPFQVQNPERAAAVSEGFARGAKGFAPADLSLAGDSGTGVTVVKLEAEKAFAAKSSAERFTWNGEAYYLNKAYFAGLSRQITALHDAGTAVMLRITGVDAEFTAELSTALAADEYIDYSSATGEPDGSDFLGALSAWAGKNLAADGRLAGIIVGEYANLIDGSIRTMNDAVGAAARSLRTVYNNLAAYNASARVCLSVSDLYTCDPATDRDELGLLEFVPALLSEIGRNGMFPFRLCIDSVWRVADEAGAVYVSECDCTALTKLLDASGGSAVRLIFCDQTYLQFPITKIKFSEASAWFVRGYYAALANDRIDAYIAVTGGDLDKIGEVVRVIDTEDGSAAADLALLTLGAEKWSEVVPGFDPSDVPLTDITRYGAVTDEPAGIKGTFRYYSFDTFTGVGSMRPGYYCGELYVADGEALAAPIGGSASGSWMGFSHRFDYPENLRITPVLKLTVRLDDVKPASVKEAPVKLVLLGNGERFESEAVIPTGKWVTLYVYTGDFGEAYDTECLQLLAGGGKLTSATLLLGSMDGLSREYTDESLESVIAEERLKKQNETGSASYMPYLWIGGAILLVAATVITFAMLSRRKDGKDE